MHSIFNIIYIVAGSAVASAGRLPMTFSPYSLGRAPRTLPIWHAILDDLGRPQARQIAKVLGVGVRTVHRWNRAGQAPKAACLALFWLTRWGHSQVHCQATNDAILAAQIARNLTDRCAELEIQLAHVLALNEHGAANEPISRGAYVSFR